jgi:hypothetical protein
MTGWKESLGAAKEIDGDQRRLRRRLPGRVPQPGDRLLVTPLRPEHQMIRHVQSVRAPGNERVRCLTVQKAPDRGQHVLLDGVV